MWVEEISSVTSLSSSSEMLPTLYQGSRVISTKELAFHLERYDVYYVEVKTNTKYLMATSTRQLNSNTRRAKGKAMTKCWIVRKSSS